MSARELDQIIHQPTRLRIMMILSALERADFTFLLKTLGLSNGNLSVHTSRLAEAGYIKISKTFENRMPSTTYRLTELGRRRLAQYWETLDQIRASAV